MPHAMPCSQRPCLSQPWHKKGVPASRSVTVVWIEWLQTQKHMRKFRVTQRLSKDVAAALNAGIRENLPKPKKKLKKKKA